LISRNTGLFAWCPQAKTENPQAKRVLWGSGQHCFCLWTNLTYRQRFTGYIADLAFSFSMYLCLLENEFWIWTLGIAVGMVDGCFWMWTSRLRFELEKGRGKRRWIRF
jgi:hypothetical protein